MFLQLRKRISNSFWRNCNQQASRRLGIEQQIPKFGRDTLSECSAVADECAIIFQTTGEVTGQRAFNRTRKIFKRGVINLE